MNYQIIFIFLISILISLRLKAMFKSDNINNLFTFFISISFIMWYLIPFILTFFDVIIILDFLEVTVDEYYELALKEFIFFYVILIGFSIFNTKRKINLTFVFKSVESSRKMNLLYNVSFIYIFAFAVYTIIFRMDYEFNNEIENQQGGFYQFLSFFYFFFIAYNWIIIIYSDESKLRKKSFFLISLISIILLLSGSRMYLLSLIYLLYFYFRIEQNKVKLIINYSIIIFITIVSILILPILATSRVGNDGLKDNLNLDNVLTMNNLVLEDLNTKLNSIAYSAILLKYDGESFAGFNPYKGSLFKFIPRFIWSEKPTPTSYNSSIDGMPSRRIPDLLGNKSDTFNTGTSAYAVSAWQMGIYGVIISIVLNVLFFIFINGLFNNPSFINKTLGFILISFPQLNILPTTGDNIILKFEEFLVYVLILILFNYVKIVKSDEDNIV